MGISEFSRFILQRTSSGTNAVVGSDYNILSKGRDKGEIRGMKDDFITLLTPMLCSFCLLVMPCQSRQSMFASGTVPGVAIQWDQQEQKCAILTMINARLPATIVLSSTFHAIRMASLPGLRRISKARLLCIQLMRRQTYCS